MVRKEKFIWVLVIVLGVWLAAFAGEKKAEKHAEVDFSISCVECHSDATPDIVKDWKGSKHGMMNFACYMCHGDGQETFAAKPGSDSCIGCHSGHEVDFSQVKVKNCFDCHGGHTLKFHKK